MSVVKETTLHPGRMVVGDAADDETNQFQVAGNTKITGDLEVTGNFPSSFPPALAPVLPTGAGKTVDDVIAALQTLGLVTQT